MWAPKRVSNRFIPLFAIVNSFFLSLLALFFVESLVEVDSAIVSIRCNKHEKFLIAADVLRYSSEACFGQ